MLSTMSHCLGAKNYVNLIIGSKQDTPIWLSAEEAAQVSYEVLRRLNLDEIW
jgi:phosphoketolase